MIHLNDVTRWRAKLQQIEAAIDHNRDVQEEWRQLDGLRPVRDSEARTLIDELVESHDPKAFRTAADAWSRRPGPYASFGGFGQMWLNQVANSLPEDPAVVDVLGEAFNGGQNLQAQPVDRSGDRSDVSASLDTLAASVRTLATTQIQGATT